jgi:hypothetical protein
MRRKGLLADLFFLLLLLGFATAYYDGWLHREPLNEHLWRQTDCLSLTTHYMEGNGFLAPEMHNRLADKLQDGKSAGELPLLYYLNGQVWKWTGESFLSYRLLSLALLIAGLFAFYRSLRLVLGSSFWGTGLTLLFFTFPLLVVYGAGFLTDAPAFALVLIALYFILKYHREKKWRHFIFAMLLFALAGGLKVSSLIAFVFLGMVLAIDTFWKQKAWRPGLFQGRTGEWSGFAGAILFILAWYVYASYYNDLHNFKYTFNHIWPLWSLPEGQYASWLEGLRYFTSAVYAPPWMILLLAGLWVTNLFLLKRIPLFAWLASLITGLGAGGYFLLWGAAFGNHDYYLIPLLILYPAIVLPFFLYVQSHFPALLKKNLVRAAFLLFLGLQFTYALSVVKLKTVATEGEFRMTFNPAFVSLMRWVNWEQQQWRHYYEMRPWLLEQGIPEDALVVSLPDPSFNTSLFLSGRKGWTDFKHYRTAADMDTLRSHGAAFLFIGKEALLSESYLAPYLQHPVGQYWQIHVFDIREDPVEEGREKRALEGI